MILNLQRDVEKSIMKAAVIHTFGDIPQYEDFRDPILGEGDVLVEVRAVALENFDKQAVLGAHYASRHMFPQFPAIVGHSGVGVRPDGAVVAFGGTRPPYGTLAEKALIPKEYANYVTRVPDGVDPAVAAALPAPALTSLLPLKWGVRMQPGETVLINGATGVSGKLAVQIARFLGANRVVGSGRDDVVLQTLAKLGADATIDLKQSDDELSAAFSEAAGGGFDVILDYVWGHPTEILFKTLTPTAAGFAPRRIRYVQIGASAGATISLSAEALRTSGLELTGASSAYAEVVPEAMTMIWKWIRERKLTMEIESMPLRDVGTAWSRKIPGGRIVITP
jgi:NADPH:quinone reductase-like Zn-dependent oxidoreductase